jgi:hypothetical protein
VNTRLTALAPLLLVLLPAPAPAAEWIADVELGVVAASRLDVRVPGEGGTGLSLVDDLSSPAAPYARGKVGVTLAGRHTLSATWAPLRLEAHTAALPKDVFFHGVTFAAGGPVSARVVQDSWRLTYRYGLLRGAQLDLDLGATALVRDSAVGLQGTWFAQKTSLDALPLASFRVAWRFAGPFALVVDGDAIAAPKERLEDVLFGVQAELRPGVAVRAGYRLVEGATESAEIHDAVLLHHLGLGLEARL